jgi:hypothetical protein
MNDFAAFILTHGRPDRVKTYHTLKKCGYTGKIYIIIDNMDETRDEYLKKYGDKVIIFNKKEIAETFDQGDNFNDMRAIIYARNASFEIAKKLGIKYFIQLDDDYQAFYFKFDQKGDYKEVRIKKNLDKVFCALLDFYKSTNISSIAMAQNGDYIGGVKGKYAKNIMLTRKCMNSFLCSTDRPFKFVGRINEDVNTYTNTASRGLILLTTNHVALSQVQTQKNKGGMTDLYLDSGTYVKSFYSVMYSPSCVTVKLMNTSNARLHHSINWKAAVPMILRQILKKEG